jgi:hypothetical protein
MPKMTAEERAELLEKMKKGKVNKAYRDEYEKGIRAGLSPDEAQAAARKVRDLVEKKLEKDKGPKDDTESIEKEIELAIMWSWCEDVLGIGREAVLFPAVDDTDDTPEVPAPAVADAVDTVPKDALPAPSPVIADKVGGDYLDGLLDGVDFSDSVETKADKKEVEKVPAVEPWGIGRPLLDPDSDDDTESGDSEETEAEGTVDTVPKKVSVRPMPELKNLTKYEREEIVYLINEIDDPGAIKKALKSQIGVKQDLHEYRSTGRSVGKTFSLNPKDYIRLDEIMEFVRVNLGKKIVRSMAVRICIRLANVTIKNKITIEKVIDALEKEDKRGKHPREID